MRMPAMPGVSITRCARKPRTCFDRRKDQGGSPNPEDAQLVLRVSAAMINVETAVLSCVGADCSVVTMLSGTPFDDQS
jgi:hypothetical protein